MARGSSLLEVLFSAGSRYGRDVTVTCEGYLKCPLHTELMPFTRSWLLKGISRIFICLILINFQLLKRTNTISTLLWFSSISGKLHRTVAVRRQSKSLTRDREGALDFQKEGDLLQKVTSSSKNVTRSVTIYSTFVMEVLDRLSRHRNALPS